MSVRHRAQNVKFEASLTLSGPEGMLGFGATGAITHRTPALEAGARRDDAKHPPRATSGRRNSHALKRRSDSVHLLGSRNVAADR